MILPDSCQIHATKCLGGDEVECLVERHDEGSEVARRGSREFECASNVKKTSAIICKSSRILCQSCKFCSDLDFHVPNYYKSACFPETYSNLLLQLGMPENIARLFGAIQLPTTTPQQLFASSMNRDIVCTNKDIIEIQPDLRKNVIRPLVENLKKREAA